MVSVLLGFMGAALFHVLKAEDVLSSQQPVPSVVTATGLNIVDSKGKIRIQLGFSGEGPPGIWVMDDKGIPRIILGLYQDQTSYFGLQDKKGQMIELMRSTGPNEIPLLIFKNNGTDKMITGLNSKVEPFLMYMKDGTSTNLFGKYEL